MDPLQYAGSAPADPRGTIPRWTFFTNHFLVVACVSARPDLRVREIAETVGITERATQTILSDLVHDGYVEKMRVGRRNRYKVRRGAAFRHPLVRDTNLGEVVDLVLSNHRASAVG